MEFGPVVQPECQPIYLPNVFFSFTKNNPPKKMPKKHSGLGIFIWNYICKIAPEMKSYCNITVMYILIYFPPTGFGGCPVATQSQNLPKARSPDGWNALMWSAQRGNCEDCRLLLQVETRVGFHGDVQVIHPVVDLMALGVLGWQNIFDETWCLGGKWCVTAVGLHFSLHWNEYEWIKRSFTVSP